MTRTENDLRDALRDLDQQAAQHEAPSTASIVAGATRHRTDAATRRLPRWLPPLAAAAAVAAVAATAVLLGTSGSSDSAPAGVAPTPTPPTAAVRPADTAAAASAAASAAARAAEARAAAAAAAAAGTSAVTLLDDAATQLTAKPWMAPAAADFFYVRTTEVTTWTSVSGERPGRGRTVDGEATDVPGCVDRQIVAAGESGSCSLNDVPHYLADAPTTPAAWDAYLERMAPGARAADAQGKIIVQVLHEDLTAPKAASALLRYTATCPGLRTVAVRPVDGQQLTGVTCTSMTNGSYGLAFDAGSHAFVGFMHVSPDGTQGSTAEIVRQTGIVTALGRRP